MRNLHSLSSYSALMEDRVQWLKDNTKEVDTSHDSLAQHREKDAVIDHFAAHDPHPKKQYTQWMMSQYKRQNIRQEDAPRVQTALQNFDRYKGKLEKKDVNQYKHVSDLEDAVQPHLGAAASNKEEKRQIKHEGADLVHSENGLQVHHLKTHEAACFYGAGTKWCTASATSGKGFFDSYSKQGPIYSIRTKNNEKYQFHFPTSQFMDAQDKQTNVHKVVSENPELRNVGPFKDQHSAFLHPGELNDKIAAGHTFKDNPIQNDGLGGKTLTPDTLNKAAHVHLGNLRGQATWPAVSAALGHIAGHPNTPEQTVKNIVAAHPTVAHVAAKNPEASADMLSHLSLHGSPTAHPIIAAHPNTGKDTLHGLAVNGNAETRKAVARNTSASNETLGHLADKEPDTHMELLGNHSLSHENLMKVHGSAMRNAGSLQANQVQEKIAEHPATTPEMLHDLAHGSNHLAASKAIANPRLPAESHQSLFDLGKPAIHAAQAKSVNTPDHILGKLSEHSLKFVADTAKKTIKTKGAA